MLKQRVITALVLAAILLASLLNELAWPFSALTLVFITAAGWEWSRLNDAPGARAWLTGAAVAGGCVYAAQVVGLPVWASTVLDNGLNVHPHVHGWGMPLAGFHVPSGVWAFACLLWVLGGAVVLRYGNTHWKRVSDFWRRLLGLLLLVVAWLALVESEAARSLSRAAEFRSDCLTRSCNAPAVASRCSRSSVLAAVRFLSRLCTAPSMAF